MDMSPIDSNDNDYENEQNFECWSIAKRPVFTWNATWTPRQPYSKKNWATEGILLHVCQVCIPWLNDKERYTLFQSLRPVDHYDFRIAEPPYIENSCGKFFCLTRRCWTILSHAMLDPISTHEAEILLNLKSEYQDIKNEILLDRKAIEYIVSATNRVLLEAKSANRLSARGGSFSVRWYY